MENNDILTESQKEFIKSNCEATADLISLTRRAFNDDSLDGRTKEGRAVRAYMSQEGLLYKRQSTKGLKV